MLNKVKTIVFSRLRRIISFVDLKNKTLNLSKRDILFKLFNKALIIFAYLVDANINIIIIENNINVSIILLKYIRLSLI